MLGSLLLTVIETLGGLLSGVLLEIFGDAGRHVRSAVGVAALPLNAAVEVELQSRQARGVHQHAAVAGPSDAVASMATTVSGILGKKPATRSPGPTP